MIITRFGRGFGLSGRAEDADLRVARRSRWAGMGVLVVFISVGVFVLLSSQATRHAARQAMVSSRLSDDYNAAAATVAAQDSLEHEYQLEPSPAVRSRNQQLTQAFDAALSRVQRDGDRSDRSTAMALSRTYAGYEAETSRLFAAVDQRDPVLVKQIHDRLVDPRTRRSPSSSPLRSNPQTGRPWPILATWNTCRRSTRV
jgi:hypothetical protein